MLIGFHAGAERRREKRGGPSSVRVQVEEKRGGGVRRGSQMASSNPRMVVAGELWRQRTTWAHAHRQGRWGRLLGGAPT
jgi:hypothetical protein